MNWMILSFGRGAILCAFTASICAAAPSAAASLKLDHRCLSFDPGLSSDSRCYGLLSDTHEGMVRVDSNGGIEPGVGEGWTWNAEEGSVEFKLKADRRWSDGQPVVAADFATAWLRVLKHGEGSNALLRSLKSVEGAENCSPESVLECASGINVLDDHTLEVRFDKPDPLFVDRLVNGALMPIPAHFYREHGEAWVYHPDRPFNGAYKVENMADLSDETFKSTSIVLTPNISHPDASDDLIPSAIYRFAPTRPSGPRTRELLLDETSPDVIFDASNVSDDIIELMKRNGWAVQSGHITRTTFLHINLETVEPELVQALKLLVNSVELQSRLPIQRSKPAHRMFNHPNAITEFDNSYAKMGQSERHEMASDLLAGIGVSRTQPRKLKLAYYQPIYTADLAKVMKNTLAPFGVDLDIVNSSSAEVLASRGKNEFDLFMNSWYVSLPDASGMLFLVDWLPISILPDSIRNEFDDLRNPEGVLLIGEQRRRQLHRAEELLVNEGGTIPLAHPQQLIFHRNDICGIVSSNTLLSPLMWMRRCAH